MLERSYSFRVSAEFFQFLIKDVWAEGDLSWDERTLIELFTLAPGTIGIGTNCEGLVSVEVQLWSSDTEFDAQPWDHVVECGIEVPSGRIALAGCCDILAEDAFSFTVTPGSCRARICFSSQYACGDSDPTCTGHYMIMLWPSQDSDAKVTKRSVDLFGRQVS